jgi:TfoX-like protein
MAFDQDLAASVRTALAGASAIREVKMFGGIGFMLNGNLVAAVSKRGLLVRVGKDHRGNALAQQGARSAAIPTDWRRGSDHPRGKPTRQWRSSADTAPSCVPSRRLQSGRPVLRRVLADFVAEVAD